MFRKLLLSAVALTLGLSLPAAAQKSSAGPKGGLTLLSVDAASARTSGATSWHAGAFASLVFGKRFAFQPEALYSAQQIKFALTTNDPTDNLLRYTTIEVPLLLKVYPLGEHLYAAAGPQVGLLIKAEEELAATGGGSALIRSVKDRFRQNNFALVAAVGADMGFVTLDARGIYGLTDLNDGSVDATTQSLLNTNRLQQRMIMLSLGLRIL